MKAQEPVTSNASTLPFYEIPDHDDVFTGGKVAARLIDALGYRFFWATEGLRSEDWAYQPVPEARSTSETIEHIYDLSIRIRNAAEGKVNDKITNRPSGEALREATLSNLWKARTIIVTMTDQELEGVNLVFGQGENQKSYPFWYVINGPVSDAIYHVGQIISFRRISGNPVSSKMNVFTGKNRL